MTQAVKDVDLLSTQDKAHAIERRLFVLMSPGSTEGLAVQEYKIHIGNQK